MEANEIKDYFCKILKEEPHISNGVAAIRTLLQVIERSNNPIHGLTPELKNAIKVMVNSSHPVAAIDSAGELLMRYITLGEIDNVDFKKTLLERGNAFLKRSNEARTKVVRRASKFILDGSKVLTHSRSRVVLETFCEAYQQGKKFEVFITVSAPDSSGKRMFKELQAIGIPCTLILDSSIGYIMEQINFIMVGAEGVMESGGIVNKVGTYTMAVCAKEMNKPFYVLTEQFKFTRVFPLNQLDVPSEYKFSSDIRHKEDLKTAHPLVDYTPPQYITLLFTDLGILTPSAVSDYLIDLFM